MTIGSTWFYKFCMEFVQFKENLTVFFFFLSKQVKSIFSQNTVVARTIVLTTTPKY